MEQLIHITAAYSNAVFLVVLTNVSDFAKKLELPIPQPITASQVQTFKPYPYKNFIGGALTLTNSDRFFYERGRIYTFYGAKNFFMGPEEWGDREHLDEWAASLSGTMNMSTNEVAEFARDALRKLGYDPAQLHADGSPTQFSGPSVIRGIFLPFCRVGWRHDDMDDVVEIDVNAEKKRIVKLYISSTNTWRSDPKLDVEPELESEFRKRTQPNWVVRTNASPRAPSSKPSDAQ